MNNVILVDHNERQQSASDIDKVRVVEVIDHHRIANFETSHPFITAAEPVGCTATILNKMYKENGIAIIQQSLAYVIRNHLRYILFKSPTCTKKTSKQLAIAKWLT